LLPTRGVTGKAPETTDRDSEVAKALHSRYTQPIDARATRVDSSDRHRGLPTRVGPFVFRPPKSATLTPMLEDEQRHPFLSTPRALGACAREFVRLGDSIADGAGDLFGDVAELKIVVRRSPERFIIQVGPSALTVAWIRSRRESAEGELLVIHWRGIVAPSVRMKPERLGEPTLSATAICESVYVVDATSETDWTWCLRDEPARRYDSASLAGALVDRLRIAYDEAAASPVPE